MLPPHGGRSHLPQKDDEDGQATELARTRCSGSSKSRPTFLVPRPTGSPPLVAPGVIKRRRNSRTSDGSPHGGRRDDSCRVGSRQQPSRCGGSDGKSVGNSDSDSSSDSSSSSSSSNSSSFGFNDVRDRHYISDSSSSGEVGKTYLAVDDLKSVENGAERTKRRGRGREHSNDDRNPLQSLDGKQTSFEWDHDDGLDTKSSRDRAEAYPLENEHRRRRRSSSSSRRRTHHKKERPPSNGWTEDSCARTAASVHDESDDDDGSGSRFRRRNSGRSMKNTEKARGSETTATPSPRDHPSGHGGSVVGDPLVDGMNEGVMGWLAEPATDTSRVRRRSLRTSAATTMSPRQESTPLSLHKLGDASVNADGPETNESAADSTPRRTGDSDVEHHSSTRRTPSSSKNHTSNDHMGRGRRTANNKILRAGGGAAKGRSSRRSPGRK